MDLVEAKTICSKGLTPTMEFVAELLAERDRLREDLRLEAMNYALTLRASHTVEGLVADAKVILTYLKGDTK